MTADDTRPVEGPDREAQAAEPTEHERRNSVRDGEHCSCGTPGCRQYLGLGPCSCGNIALYREDPPRVGTHHNAACGRYRCPRCGRPTAQHGGPHHQACPVPAVPVRCNCHTNGNASLCPVHTQADYDAAELTREAAPAVPDREALGRGSDRDEGAVYHRLRPMPPAPIAGWNYRITLQRTKWGESWTVREVYYDTEGRPVSWTMKPCYPAGEDRAELLADLDQMRADAAMRAPLDITDPDNPTAVAVAVEWLPHADIPGITPETCPDRASHGKPFLYCPVKGCGWREGMDR